MGLALANASAVVVDDSDIGNRYREAGTPTLLAPRTVQVSLALVGPISVLNTFLTDGANTGLAAPGDGGMWPGMTNVVLPFA